MPMTFNDVSLQYRSLQKEIDGAVREVLQEGPFILGPRGSAFEREFTATIGTRHGVGVGSGTSALELILDALGVGPGDEVVVPAVSAAATAMAVRTLGARPVFADVAAETWTIDPASVRDRIGPRTRAIVAVHLYGMPADMEALAALGPPVVEDAAQGAGSILGSSACGSIGVAAAFSFYPTKNLGAYGDGGMVVTSDDRIADHVRKTRNYGQTRNYVSDIRGWNSRLDEVQAAILRVKLPRLAVWNQRRNSIGERYDDALGHAGFRTQTLRGWTNRHLYVIRHRRRDALREFLTMAGIPTLIHYPSALPEHPAFADTDPDDCPEARNMAGEVCSLPIHAFMSDEEVRLVTEAVVGFGPE